jgi:2'-5' RNA ligase
MPERSAVIVPVPAAEPVVGGLRAELDRSAAEGVPAHVTVLFPFVVPSAIDDGVIEGLRAAVATVPTFTVSFGHVAWFGEDVVWLAPEPAGPFIALTAAVQERFGLLPYGGAFGDDVVPHLTVGHDAPRDRLRAAAAEVAIGLPVRAEITSAHLIVGSRAPGSWRTVAELPLGPTRSQSGAAGPAPER